MKRFTRFTFIVCTIIATLAGATLAQSAPSTLTADERKEAAKYLEETRKSFLESVKGLSEAQWKFKAAPDKWSVAEVAEHIAISEETILSLVTDRVMKSPAAPEKKEAAKGKEKLLPAMLTDRSNKVQAPEMLKPTNRWANQADLTKSFNASRDKTLAYVNTTQDDLRSHFGPHPILKELDAYQWIFLIAGHSARHTAQINEVKADPNFPKK
jgi:hypothetical protein